MPSGQPPAAAAAAAVAPAPPTPWRSPLGCTPAGGGATAQAAAAAFHAWCDAEAVLWPKCAVAEVPGTGRGVVAVEEISPDEVVVEVTILKWKAEIRLEFKLKSRTEAVLHGGAHTGRRLPRLPHRPA